ncbi:MAG: SPASM domain-containing protein [Clostridia bacterium]|nr:SPASM domain-containing protein [Clostridia bacterium]
MAKTSKYVKKSHYNYYVNKYGMAFLWNTASDACLLLNEDEDACFNNLSISLINSDFLNSLFSLGFLVEVDFDEVFRINLLRKRHAYTYPSDGHVDIEILPTQTCNARCFYCFEQKYNCLTMDKATISRTVEYICSRINSSQDVCFIWFGGEPLLGEKIIDKILEQINLFYGGQLSYCSSITTNNSLLTRGLVNKFLGLWKVNDVLTTIDGYREEHNLRKAYVGKKFDAYNLTLENLNMLSETGIKTTCRINLDKDNISQLDKILTDLLPLLSHPNFAVQVSTLRDKTSSKTDLSKYFSVEEYDSFYREVMPLLYEMGFIRNALEQLPTRNNINCIACSMNKIVINSNGKLFKCLQDSLSDDNSVGDCQNGISTNNNYAKWYKEIDNIGDKCEQCIFLPCCQGGCKYYRMNPSLDTTPCFRKKYYIDYIIEQIIKQFSKERK